MTAMERLPISVTLIVTVDGHTLTFTETGEAKGNRDWVQRPKGYTDDDTLEAQIRLTVMAAAEAARRKATEALRRLYPVPRELGHDT